ncbi:MAG: pyridoxamine 5'-phosphate oxidase family protein [Bacteroidales bacterium]
MSTLPLQFLEVIRQHHLLTLATSVNDEPYCSTVFYAYLEEENCFVFTSNTKTKHVQDISHNMCVSGNIALETKEIGKIQGIQIQGMALQPEKDLLKLARKNYLKCFPYAIAFNATFWILEPTWAKLTDNRLGFGKKMIWERPSLVDIEFLRKKNTKK